MHVQLDKKLVTLSSYNPAYPPTQYHRDEFNWIFPVASVIKHLRKKWGQLNRLFSALSAFATLDGLKMSNPVFADGGVAQ